MGSDPGDLSHCGLGLRIERDIARCFLEGLFTFENAPHIRRKRERVAAMFRSIHEILEVVEHRIRRRIAVFGELSQRAHGDPCERRRDARVDGLRRQNLASRDLLEREKLRSLSEQDSASGQLIENDPQREDVCSSVERASETLLGAHVAGLSFDHAGRRLAIRGHRFCDAKVDDFRDAVVADQDVLRRNVAMHESVRMRVGKRLRHVGHNTCNQAIRERSPPLDGAHPNIAETLARDVLHRHEVALIVAAQVVDLNDVAVVKAGGAPSLFEEHLDERVLPSQMRQDLLHGDTSSEARRSTLHGKPDLSHAAGPDLANQAIATRGSRGGVWPWLRYVTSRPHLDGQIETGWPKKIELFPRPRARTAGR